MSEENTPLPHNNEEHHPPPLNESSTDETTIAANASTEAQQPPETSNQKPETEMEVHHHTHHPKKFKEYFWEFFMLFLAVFCGFLAEYKLEQTIERHREKEFIVSMLEDATLDTANIHKASGINRERIKYLDTLAYICFNYTGTQQERTHLYFAHRHCVYYPDLVFPTDRTLFQLKNSGGMRLIKNKYSAEAIIAYDNSGRKLLNQQGYYEKYLNDLTEASKQTMNFSQLFSKAKPGHTRFEDAMLINPTTERMFILGNNALMFKGIILQYLTLLDAMEKEATQLTNTLKKEYHLK